MKLCVVLVGLCLVHLLTCDAVAVPQPGAVTSDQLDVSDALKKLGVAVLQKATDVVGKALEAGGDVAVAAGAKLKAIIPDTINKN